MRSSAAARFARFREHRASRRASGRVESRRISDFAVFALLFVAALGLFFLDETQPLSATQAKALSSGFASTDLALPRFLRTLDPGSRTFSLALLPSVRQASDRAWGGRVSDLDFAGGDHAPSGSDPLSHAAAVGSSSGDGVYDDAERPSGTGAGAITSGFGFRRMGGTVRHHDGIDISLPYGAPIRAHEDGVVVHAGWRNGYGLTVIIDHGSGKETLYAHASALRVREGQVVRAGEVIAAVGTTGRAYGAHLHFEIRHDGRPVDPEREYVSLRNG